MIHDTQHSGEKLDFTTWPRPRLTPAACLLSHWKWIWWVMFPLFWCFLKWIPCFDFRMIFFAFLYHQYSPLFMFSKESEYLVLISYCCASLSFPLQRSLGELQWLRWVGWSSRIGTFGQELMQKNPTCPSHSYQHKYSETTTTTKEGWDWKISFKYNVSLDLYLLDKDIRANRIQNNLSWGKYIKMLNV